MAAVHVEARIRASAQQVWQALAAPGEAHRAFAALLKDCRMESEDLRIATFANGRVVKERIVSVEPQRMRIAYSVIESQFAHHSASMQVVARGNGECDFVWTADVLPHAAAAAITPLMEQGAKALKTGMEDRGSPPARG